MRRRVSGLVILIITLNCVIHYIFTGELTHVFLSLVLICIVVLVTKVCKINETSE